MTVPVKRSFELTRTHILDAAERAFAQHGFEGSSLRDITARARANLAAVHYHFGSKRALVKAVLDRRFVPLNAERLRLLDACEATAGRDGPTLAAILYAFIDPALRLLREHPAFMQLAGRLHTESDPPIMKYFLRRFEKIVERFRAALTRALPAVPVEELFWRMHFVMGAMLNTVCGCRGLEKFSRGLCRAADPKATDRLIAFCEAGLRAPLKGGDS